MPVKREIMDGIVSIFVMPYEKEDLFRVLELLSESLEYLSEDMQLSLDITYCLSSEFLLESEEVIKGMEKDFIKEVTPLLQPFSERTLRVEKGVEILGCVSQRRNTYREFPDKDFYIWLDPNLHFLPETLFYLTEGFRSVREVNPFAPLVIVPQVTRLWDYTWDVLVHPKYKKEKFGYCYEIDPEEVLLIDEEVSIEESRMHKFGGGWMTLLSREILENIGVPEELGHYGMEDTYIMWRMRERDYKQYILGGVVVSKDYKALSKKKFMKTMKIKDQKDEMREYAKKGFQKLFKTPR